MSDESLKEFAKEFEAERLSCALRADIRKALLKAAKDKKEGQPLEAGHDLLFYAKYHPELLEDIDKTVERIWSSLREEAESSNSYRDFLDVILPALSPKPADTKVWERQALRAIVDADPFHSPDPLLTADDLRKPFEIDTSNTKKLYRRIRL